MAKAKDDRLSYSVVGTVLTVSLPDEADSFNYDASDLKRFPGVVDKLLVHTVKKLLQERTSDADSTEERFEGMRNVIRDFQQGRFKAQPKVRRKLPDWLKGKVREVQAIAALKGATMDAIYTTLEKLGAAGAAKVFASEAVQEQMEKDAKSDAIDLSDLTDE